MANEFSITDIKSRITKDSKGISNYINVSIEEMDWLLKQAEQVETLQREKDSIINIARISDEGMLEFANDAEKYHKALKKIVCLNIPMPDEVFNIANNALESND